MGVKITRQIIALPTISDLRTNFCESNYCSLRLPESPLEPSVSSEEFLLKYVKSEWQFKCSFKSKGWYTYWYFKYK